MTKEELLHYQTLTHILATSSLTPVFQPIISLKDNKIYGYEGLIRGPSNSPLHSPIKLFNVAAKHGRLADLDLLCRQVTIKKFGQMKLNAKLFVNTTPQVLLQNDYKHGLTLKYLKQAGMEASQVVIEITEQYPIDDYELMVNATKHYQEMGFSIALDDLGAGYSGLRTWSEIRPDFVKIDRHFLQNIHEDTIKQQFLKTIIEHSKAFNCKVIGEGIEVREEYITANDMNIGFAQGYYFARPAKHPERTINPRLFKTRNTPYKAPLNIERSSTTVSTLLFYVKPISIHTLFDDIGERFQSSKELSALPVINTDSSIAGIIWRTDFLTIYASRYGKELYKKKPASFFIDKKPLTVKSDLTLSKLSQQVTSQSTDIIHDDFIITASGRYKGMGKLIDLLKAITDMQISFARHMNPLSNLPGNVPISQKIRSCINSRQDVVICYFDLDNFKPYNDTYGFGKGDKVLRKTARLLCQYANEDLDFVGHVGGDDFIIIFSSKDWKKRCEKILHDFTTFHAELYSQEHFSMKGIAALDRNSKSVFFPLLSISIGAIRPYDFEGIESEDDLVAAASTAKSQAKKIVGNSLYQLQPEVAAVSNSIRS